jgi:TolB-like protein
MKRHVCLLVIAGILITLSGQIQGQVVRRNQQTLHKQISHPGIKAGIDLFKKQQYREAEKEFLRVLNKEPQNLIAKEMLAGVYYHLQDVEQARKYSLLSLRQNKKSGYPFMVLAWVASTEGKMLAARDFILKAERLAKTELIKDEIKKYKENYKSQLQNKTISDTTMVIITSAGEQPYLAVFPFEDNTDQADSSKLGEMVSEMMITALAQSNRYRLMERSQLGKVLDEQALGQSGAVEPQTAVEVGKLVGVTAIVVGSISKLNDRLELDARIIEASSGAVQKAANNTAAEEGKLRAAVNELAIKLSGD